MENILHFSLKFSRTELETWAGRMAMRMFPILWIWCFTTLLIPMYGSHLVNVIWFLSFSHLFSHKLWFKIVLNMFGLLSIWQYCVYDFCAFQSLNFMSLQFPTSDDRNKFLKSCIFTHHSTLCEPDANSLKLTCIHYHSTGLYFGAISFSHQLLVPIDLDQFLPTRKCYSSFTNLFSALSIMDYL